MRQMVEQIIDKNTDKSQIVSEILDLMGLVGRLSFKEIEALVQLKHSDDWEYGNDEKRCAELIEATRNKIGYTKADVKTYL